MGKSRQSRHYQKVISEKVADGNASKHNVITEKLQIEMLPSTMWLQKRAKGPRWDWVFPDTLQDLNVLIKSNIEVQHTWRFPVVDDGSPCCVSRLFPESCPGLSGLQVAAQEAWYIIWMALSLGWLCVDRYIFLHLHWADLVLCRIPRQLAVAWCPSHSHSGECSPTLRGLIPSL